MTVIHICTSPKEFIVLVWFVGLFVYLSAGLQKINTTTPLHIPAGRCHIAKFTKSIHQTDTCRSLYICDRAEERDREGTYGYVFFSYGWTSHHVLCYWLGATSPLPKNWCRETSPASQKRKEKEYKEEENTGTHRVQILQNASSWS